MSHDVLARLGRAARLARRRRRLTQARLGGLVGLSQSEISRIELGQSGWVSLSTWLALAEVLGLVARFELARDWREAPADAGHLAIQEFLLRLARATGRDGTFELLIGSNDLSLSTDVFVRDDRWRRLIIEEAWNTFGDIGSGARSFDRKMAAAREVAIAIGGDRPYSVHGVWVVRATKRNRELLARYPEIFARRFPGSSTRWVAALTRGERPPDEPGLVWCSNDTTELHAWRPRRSRQRG
jgi:transcriptional regulator with XRE-family HTH domain